MPTLPPWPNSRPSAVPWRSRQGCAPQNRSWQPAGRWGYGRCSAPSAPATDKRAAPARPPREPITWDRIWQTLLSERTLNVLLFLGAFLLIASATTYVVYNWETLPPAVQLAFIVLFTLSFYGAGWFLRVRMKLRLSGIAVTAVGSLLVPLDFYAVLIEGGVWPAGAWPWAWLLASAVCLPIYTFTALRIRAQFFGYLVAVAAGSLVCATLQVAGVDPQWWLAALAALALALAALAYRLGAVDSTWAILSNPFRLSALIATSVILPLGFGWWVVGDMLGFDYEVSLAVAWAMGAILYTYAAVHERSPLLGRAAATALPVALFLLLRLAFQSLDIEGAWYALGWALLAPVYLWAGHRFYTRAQAVAQDGDEQASSSEEPVSDPVLRAHSHTATAWALALMAVAAVWSVFDLWAAAATYAALAAGVTLAIYLWERPRALPLASLLAFSSITFAMAAGHLEPAELCLGWALLALLHVIAALRLRTAPDYAARLYAAALVLAAIAILPPLMVSHEPLLTYVLGQWIVLAGWLLWLDHSGQQPGLQSPAGPFWPLAPLCPALGRRLAAALLCGHGLYALSGARCLAGASPGPPCLGLLCHRTASPHFRWRAGQQIDLPGYGSLVLSLVPGWLCQQPGRPPAGLLLL